MGRNIALKVDYGTNESSTVLRAKNQCCNRIHFPLQESIRYQVIVSLSIVSGTSRSLGVNATHDWKRVKFRSNIQYMGTDRLEDSRTTVDNYLGVIQIPDNSQLGVIPETV